MIKKINSIVKEYPGKFWILLSASFIDNLGRTMIGPFLALYITRKLDVGMTEAGSILGLFLISGMIGSTISGALTDKIGRKSILLFGLVFSAVSSLSLALAESLNSFYLIAVFVGLLSNMGGPARHAMVADLLPEEKRTEGFGTLRVTNNMAWIIGPMIGGFLASYSFTTIFIIDIISSLITASIVLLFIPETKNYLEEKRETESLLKTFKGYGDVLRNRQFMLFISLCAFMWIAYRQCYAPLSVYMRDVHGFTAGNYGSLISINAVLVVLFQFPITRQIKKYAPYLVLSAGLLFLMTGLLLFSISYTYLLFLSAIIFISIGEMLLIPISQSMVVSFAPEDKRGRYLALNMISWNLPSALAPLIAGLILDNLNPDWLWYASAMFCLISLIGFLLMHRFSTTDTITKEE